jgi:hypothetical protein
VSPDFRELVGDDLPPEEEARLRQIHDLLVTAGPPEELPPALAAPPADERRSNVVPFPGPRRRLGAAVVLAASLASLLFGGGYWLGADRQSFQAEETFSMRGPSNAFASVKMAPADDAFNWPLELHVRGLRDLPKGGYYELLLTRKGKLGLSCGTFRTHDGKTTIVLNAPYPLKQWDGWVVIAHEPGGETSAPVLTTKLS